MEQKTCTVQKFSACIWKKSEWRCLGEDALPPLVRNIKCKTFYAGDEIYSPGDAATGVHLIESGLVSIERDSLEGVPVLFALAGPGDTLGFNEALNGVSHRNAAVALETVRACFIQSDFLCQAVGSNPQLGMEFLKTASSSLNDADERYYRMISYRARARVAHYLLQLSERYGKADKAGILEISMPCSRSKLASLIGVRTESLSRSLGKLRDAEIIRSSGRKIFVYNIVGLEQEAAGFEKTARSRGVVAGATA